MSDSDNIFLLNPKKTISIIFTVFLIGVVTILENYLSVGSQDHSVPKKQGLTRSILLREHVPNQDIVIVPDSKYVEEKDSLTRKEYRFRTDKNGFILPVGPSGVTNSIKVIFLGGSTTECMFVSELKRFPYLTGQVLQKIKNINVTSYNGGVSGNNSMHSNDILINKVIPMAPDFVLFHHNINDLGVLMLTEGYWDTTPSRNLIYEKSNNYEITIYNILKYFRDKYIPNLYSKIKSVADIGSVLRKDEWESVRGTLIKPDRNSIFKEFGKSLQLFINISRTYDIKPILLTQANRFTKEPDAVVLKEFENMKNSFGVSYSIYKELYDGMNQVIRDVAIKNNVTIIDLDKEVAKSSQYMYDSVHYNDEGSELVAGIIAEKLSTVLD